MKTAASPAFSIFAPLPANLPDAATEVAEWTIGVGSLRPQANDRLWNSYLPEDRVTTTTEAMDRTA